MAVMEAFIREARLVTLSFFVDDRALKQHANLLLERRVTTNSSQFKENTSLHAIRARALDDYFDAGMRYFRRYALTNLVMFMNEESQNKFNYLVEEIVLIDEVISEIRQGIKMGENTFAELGEYLMIHIRLTAVKDNIEKDMIMALDGPNFRPQILPDVARIFYEDNKKRKIQRTLGTFNEYSNKKTF